LTTCKISHSGLEHWQAKEEDIDTKGDCCFSHIIGLSKNKGREKPILLMENYFMICY
jgi:hypothetical protein